MRATFLAMAMTLAIGCADPEAAPFLPMATATLIRDDGRAVSVLIFRGAGPVARLDREVGVPSGTRVTVLEDRPAPAPVQPTLRLVSVRVEEGRHRGLTGTVSRQDLRSSP